MHQDALQPTRLTKPAPESMFVAQIHIVKTLE
jgi:hypothetical protein